MFCVILCFFFFKQKTAYEMRISDWSSDVCSSDLDGTRLSPVFSHFISAILAARPYAGPTSSWASPARFCSIRATCCGSKATDKRSANPLRDIRRELRAHTALCRHIDRKSVVLRKTVTSLVIQRVIRTAKIKKITKKINASLL